VALTVGLGVSTVTVTLSSALGPSQPFSVWLTKYEVMPDTVVEGVGAVARAVPPDAAEYHLSAVPVAVNGNALALKQ
jgi:hypothetical protein